MLSHIMVLDKEKMSWIRLSIRWHIATLWLQARRVSHTRLSGKARGASSCQNLKIHKPFSDRNPWKLCHHRRAKNHSWRCRSWDGPYWDDAPLLQELCKGDELRKTLSGFQIWEREAIRGEKVERPNPFPRVGDTRHENQEANYWSEYWCHRFKGIDWLKDVEIIDADALKR